MSSRNPPLSIEQVLEIVPSAESWIDDGLIGRVLFIDNSPPTARKKYWKTTLGSDTSGARITMTMFAPPKFSPGCLLEITGAGIKRKEFNGADEVGVGPKVEFHVIDSAPPQRQAPPPRQSSPANDARGGSYSNPPAAAPTPPASTIVDHAPAPQSFSPVPGITVGMVMKESINLVVLAFRGTYGNFTIEHMLSAEFAKLTKEMESRLIRRSIALQAGKLNPNPWAKPADPAPPPAPPTPPPVSPPPRVETPPPAPPPANQAPKSWTPGVDPDDDIPF